MGLAAWLQDMGVELVILESTGILPQQPTDNLDRTQLGQGALDLILNFRDATIDAARKSTFSGTSGERAAPDRQRRMRKWATRYSGGTLGCEERP